MQCKNVSTSLFGFVAIHAFYRQTNRRTDRKALKYCALQLHAVARKKLSVIDLLSLYWR